MDALAESRSLRVGVDLSIVRHGPSGSARWASGLADALAQRTDLTVRRWTGRRRLRFRGPIRKVLNAALDRYYYEVALPASARGWRADALLMPVNLTARRSAVPQVVTILDVNFLVEPESYDPLFRRYATRMFARSARDADVVTTISEYSRAEIAARLDVPISRIEVVYPGLSAAVPTRAPAPMARPYALYVGPSEPHKNIGLAIRAWEDPALRPLPLVIVGRPGRAHPEIERLASRLPERVHVIGAVGESELERWYAGAQVFVFPSLTEGFGYPPLEAMQRGIPVVAASAGSLPEVLGEAALYHDPSDVDALRGAVKSILDDADLRSRLSISGRQRAARYTWASTGTAMAEALRRAIAQRR